MNKDGMREIRNDDRNLEGKPLGKLRPEDKAERRTELIWMIGREVVKVGGRRNEPRFHKVTTSDVINVELPGSANTFFVGWSLGLAISLSEC
jgi:hypothetical protein